MNSDVLYELNLLRSLAAHPEDQPTDHRNAYAQGYQDALDEVFEILEDELEPDE